MKRSPNLLQAFEMRVKWSVSYKETEICLFFQKLEHVLFQFSQPIFAF